jgi:hypothetical protein
MMSNAGV